VQGIGTGGEVPVASAYITELIGSKGRGKFFLLDEVMFLLGLVGAGLIGYFLVPVYGWKAMFVVGLVPALIMIPLRWFVKESPRWLAANGRYGEA
ncbi:MFS transporter, partial [Rhizobium ruizarguesonis]